MRSGSIMRAFRATAAAFTFFSFFDGSGCRPAAAFLTSPARSRPGRGAAAGITATDCVRSLSSKQQLSLVEVHSPLLQQVCICVFMDTWRLWACRLLFSADFPVYSAPSYNGYLNC